MLFLLLVVGGITHVLVLLLGLTVAGGPHTPLWEMAFSVVSITSILLWRFTTPLVHRGIVCVLLILVCARWTVSWMLSGPNDVLATTVSGLLYMPLLITIARLLGVGLPFVFSIVAWISMAASVGSFREELSQSSLAEWRVGLAIFFAMALFIRFQQVWVKHLESLNKLSERHIELARVASVDELTGLMNRRIGQLQMEQSTLSQGPTSCLLADLDYFKSINDNFGHPAGDEVLRRVAKLIRRSCRSTDTICRWGGEEFLVILDNTTPEAAIKVAEKIRRNIERGTLRDNIPVTISIGVAHKRNADTIDSLMSRADQALYEAKISGRNRVEALSAA